MDNEVIEIWAWLNGYENLARMLSGKLSIKKYLQTAIKEDEKQLIKLKESLKKSQELLDRFNKKYPHGQNILGNTGEIYKEMVELNLSKLKKVEHRLNMTKAILQERFTTTKYSKGDAE